MNPTMNPTMTPTRNSSFSIVLAAGWLLMTTSTIASAQVQVNIDQSLAPKDWIANVLEQMATIGDLTKPPVFLTPDVVAIDAKTDSAIVTVANKKDDTVKVRLLLQHAPLATGVTSTSASNAVLPDTSLVLWVTGVPHDLTLTSHEKRQLVIHVKPLPSAKPGLYVAHLVVFLQSAVRGGVEMRMPASSPAIAPRAIQLQYHVAPQ
jgi:hypothetical protein